MIHSGLRFIEIEGKGRGMVCQEDLYPGDTIEVSPVVVMGIKEQEHLDQTRMHDYIFLWGDDENPQCCVALGYVSMYNHSYSSNCDYLMHYDQDLIEIKVVQHVPAGTELTINYNGEPNDETRIWFDVKEEE